MNTIEDNIQIPLAPFLTQLKARGFLITIDTYQLVNVLLTNHETTNFEELKTLLCPIIAQNPEQQELFYRTFDTYFKDIRGKIIADNPKEIDLPEPKMQPTQTQSSSEKSRTLVIIGTVLAFVVIIILLLLINPNIIGGQGQNGEPKPTFTIPKPDPILAYWIALIIGLLAITSLLFTRIQRTFLDLLKKLLKNNKLYPSLNPPFVFLPRVNLPEIDFFSNTDVLELVYPFQKLANYTYDTSKINVAKTLKQTIRNAGRVEISYQLAKQAYSYLILIDETYSRNHQIPWYSYIADILKENYSQVQVYFFENDPRMCWEENSKKVKSLNANTRKIKNLSELLGEQRVLFFGNLHTLINPIEGEPYKWASEILQSDNQIGILTPVPLDEWNIYEKVLNTYTILVPETIEGLLKIIQNFDKTHKTTLDYWQDKAPHPRFYNVPYFKRHYAESFFYWICACAVYPEVYWELTLHIAKKIENHCNISLLNKENLNLLVHIKWFREGKFPDDIRKELIAELPKDLLVAIREAIIELIEAQTELPNKDSYAYRDLQLNLLQNQIAVHPDNMEYLKEFRTLSKGQDLSSDSIMEAFAASLTWEILKEKLQRFILSLFNYMFEGPLLLGLGRNWEVLKKKLKGFFSSLFNYMFDGQLLPGSGRNIILNNSFFINQRINKYLLDKPLITYTQSKGWIDNQYKNKNRYYQIEFYADYETYLANVGKSLSNRQRFEADTSLKYIHRFANAFLHNFEKEINILTIKKGDISIEYSLKNGKLYFPYIDDRFVGNHLSAVRFLTDYLNENFKTKSQIITIIDDSLISSLYNKQQEIEWDNYIGLNTSSVQVSNEALSTLE